MLLAGAVLAFVATFPVSAHQSAHAASSTASTSAKAKQLNQEARKVRAHIGGGIIKLYNAKPVKGGPTFEKHLETLAPGLREIHVKAHTRPKITGNGVGTYDFRAIVKVSSRDNYRLLSRNVTSFVANQHGTSGGTNELTLAPLGKGFLVTAQLRMPGTTKVVNHRAATYPAAGEKWATSSNLSILEVQARQLLKAAKAGAPIKPIPQSALGSVGG